jgi:hypothetical protein
MDGGSVEKKHHTNWRIFYSTPPISITNQTLENAMDKNVTITERARMRTCTHTSSIHHIATKAFEHETSHLTQNMTNMQSVYTNL